MQEYEFKIPMSRLVSGFTKKHFTELSMTGICTCICPECGIESVKHHSTNWFGDAPVCHLVTGGFR
jgi:hypothetical protein